jgi:drug/metabolite transporter superfamily protein YnfA
MAPSIGVPLERPVFLSGTKMLESFSSTEQSGHTMAAHGGYLVEQSVKEKMPSLVHCVKQMKKPVFLPNS